MKLLKNIFGNKKRAVIKKDHEKLKKQTLSKLNYALHKKKQDMFINVIREFFAERYHIKYEFTFAELLKSASRIRLKKDAKARLFELMKRIEDEYYSSEKIENVKLMQFGHDFRIVLKDL